MAAQEASTEIATREGPVGQPLGVRRKPQLRLALGYRDETKKGAPVKTDYFIPKGGDRAVVKFQQVYGEKPRAIDIRLPGSLGQFLEIKHMAFAGGQNGEGGILKAVGDANFALEGSLGGPDVLTVFDVVDNKLDVQRVEITGVDDPEAQRLGVRLATTATFGIPDVLGFGGVCQVTSHGKETADTLWLTAVDIYASLGPAASMLLRPKLLLKESRMLTPRGQRVQVFVLDLYVPESLDEIADRAREWKELIPARAAAASASLYGPRELMAGTVTPPADEAELVDGEIVDETPAGRQGEATGTDGATAATVASSPDPAEADPGPEEGSESLFQPPPSVRKPRATRETGQ